jgi:hypothetical protein
VVVVVGEEEEEVEEEKDLVRKGANVVGVIVEENVMVECFIVTRLFARERLF